MLKLSTSIQVTHCRLLNYSTDKQARSVFVTLAFGFLDATGVFQQLYSGNASLHDRDEQPVQLPQELTQVMAGKFELSQPPHPQYQPAIMLAGGRSTVPHGQYLVAGKTITLANPPPDGTPVAVTYIGVLPATKHFSRYNEAQSSGKTLKATGEAIIWELLAELGVVSGTEI